MTNSRAKLPKDLKTILGLLDEYWVNKKDMNKDSLNMLLGKLEIAIDDLEEVLTEIEEKLNETNTE